MIQHVQGVPPVPYHRTTRTLPPYLPYRTPYPVPPVRYHLSTCTVPPYHLLRRFDNPYGAWLLSLDKVKQTYLLYTACSLTLVRRQVLVDHLEVVPVDTNRWKVRCFVRHRAPTKTAQVLPGVVVRSGRRCSAIRRRPSLPPATLSTP